MSNQKCDRCMGLEILQANLIRNKETGEAKVLVKLCDHYSEVADKNLEAIASVGYQVEIVR